MYKYEKQVIDLSTQKIFIDRTIELLSDIEKLKKEKTEIMDFFREHVAKKVAEARAEALRDQWISVDDRMPGIDQEVLTFGIVAEQWGYFPETTLVCENALTIEGWLTSSRYKPTHWMPLPEPPSAALDGKEN